MLLGYQDGDGVAVSDTDDAAGEVAHTGRDYVSRVTHGEILSENFTKEGVRGKPIRRIRGLSVT